MSLKDMNYCRKCPICADILVGTDDGLEVYVTLKAQVDEGTPNPTCTLCGLDTGGLNEAKDIVARGEPHLNKVK